MLKNEEIIDVLRVEKSALAMKKLAAEQKSLEKFLGSYIHVSVNKEWNNLHFTDSGLGRLAHTAGWFRGLVQCGKRAEAGALAHDLDGMLTHLSGYGGFIELKEGINTLKFPTYRIILGDDGTFGGWSLVWCRYFNNETVLAGAEKLAEMDLERDWLECLSESKTNLKIHKELELFLYYRHEKTETDNDYWPMHSKLAHYGYAFNGGLLYSGPGGDETFAVNLEQAMGKSDRRFWSTHT